MSQAVLIIRKAITELVSWPGYVVAFERATSDDFLFTTLVVLMVFVAIEWIQRRQTCPLELRNWPTPMRWAVYTILLWTALDLMPPASGQQFLYFRF